MKILIRRLITLGSLAICLTSCAASRTAVDGLYTEPPIHTNKKPVNVLFDFYFYSQEIGRDAIPKLLNSPEIYAFNDIFKESIKELSNIGTYETFRNSASHIDDIEKRNERDNKITQSDYVVKIEINRKNSFAKHVLGYLITLSFFDFVPVPYSWDYTFTVSLINKADGLIGKYSRTARVTNWYQVLLIAVYPFHPEERKTEEIYLESLTNIFRQVENENVLK